MVVPPKPLKMIIFSRKNPWLLGTTILGNPHVRNIYIYIYLNLYISYMDPMGMIFFIAESTSFKDNFESCRPRWMQSAKLRIHDEHLTVQIPLIHKERRGSEMFMKQSDMLPMLFRSGP